VTLLELMIAIVMIGILCAIGLTRLDWKRYQADSAGRGVMGELATAQRLALSLQSNMVITLPDTNRMQVVEDKNNDGAASSGERSIRARSCARRSAGREPSASAASSASGNCD